MLSHIEDIYEYKQQIDSVIVPVSAVINELTISKNVSWGVARFDLLDRHLSGNKVFKLLPYLLHAKKNHIKQLVSFGGMHSNHLHALAHAGSRFGFQVIALIRGYASQPETETLKDIRRLGAEVHFLDRSIYSQRNNAGFIQAVQRQFPSALIIPEGGAGVLGELGAQSMLEVLRRSIVSAPDLLTVSAGTGVTAKGFLQSAPLSPNTKLMVYSALANAVELHEEFMHCLSLKSWYSWQISDEFCLGGFAKINNELAEFMSVFFRQQQLLLDAVYTAKMCYGVMQQLANGSILPGTSIISVHTGGLQGVRGLPEHYQALLKVSGE